MKKYNGLLHSGLKLIYAGRPMEWVNPKTGKVNEVMKPGRYVISRIQLNLVYLKADRKNAAKEHAIYIGELKDRIYVPEWIDLTTPIAQVFTLNKSWYINDEELIKKAKAYNKAR